MGILISWVNTFLLLLVAIVTLRRRPELKWFALYAAVISGLSLGWKLMGSPYELYAWKRGLGYLLTLIAIYEVWQKSPNEKRYSVTVIKWWLVGAGVWMLISANLHLGSFLQYQLPQFLLIGGMAVFLLPTGIKGRDPILTGWGLYGLEILISDLLKLINSEAVGWQILQITDTSIFAVMCLFWLTNIPHTERAGAGWKRVGWSDDVDLGSTARS